MSDIHQNTVTPTQWPSVFDIWGDVRFDWMYPNIYERTPPLSRISISLSHVRAADALIIEFSGERDGWVLRMDRTRDEGGYRETVEEAVEVGFIPAWLDAEPEDLPPSAHHAR